MMKAATLVATIWLLSLCVGTGMAFVAGMKRNSATSPPLQLHKSRVIHTAKAPSGPGGAAQGLVDSNGFLTTSIQYGALVPPTPNTTTTSSSSSLGIVSGGPKAQMQQAMNNIAGVFTAAGYNLTTDANDCWLYGFNADTFGEISGVYNTFFPTLNHPARNPTGAGLVSSWSNKASTGGSSSPPAIAVRCTGFPNGGLRVRPQNFFLSDFNAQAMVSAGSSLTTAAQLGMNPVSGKVVNENSLREQTLQALSNIAVVFTTVMPELSWSSSSHSSSVSYTALRQRGVSCQLMINESLWDESSISTIEEVVQEVFGSNDKKNWPIVNYRSYPNNTLPLVAGVAVTCDGDTSLVERNQLVRDSDNFTLGMVSRYTIPQLRGRSGSATAKSTITTSSEVRKLTTVPLVGISTDGNEEMWSTFADAFRYGLETSTQGVADSSFCEIIAKNEAAAQGALRQFNSKTGHKVPVAVTVARFRGDDIHDFNIQCRG